MTNKLFRHKLSLLDRFMTDLFIYWKIRLKCYQYICVCWKCSQTEPQYSNLFVLNWWSHELSICTSQSEIWIYILYTYIIQLIREWLNEIDNELFNICANKQINHFFSTRDANWSDCNSCEDLKCCTRLIWTVFMKLSLSRGRGINQLPAQRECAIWLELNCVLSYWSCRKIGTFLILYNKSINVDLIFLLMSTFWTI